MEQIKLEVGKTYRNRKGEEIKIAWNDNTKDYPFQGSNRKWYTESGQWCNMESPHDLVEEVPSESCGLDGRLNLMEWIKITDKLPEFGKRVLFRGKTAWKTKLNPIDFFDDELTREEEALEYGESAYILQDHSDWLVSQHPNISDICDQFITHWCEIPESFS